MLKTNFNTKFTGLENSEFNTVAANSFNARLAQANLITKAYFDAKLSNLNRKVTAIKTKHFIDDNDLSYYRGKQYIDEGSGKQNYLVFLPMRKYFTLNSVANTVDHVLSWQSKGLSNEIIKPPTTTDNSLTLELIYHGTKTKI